MADALDTLPVGVPKLTLGYGVIRHAARWIVQPNGPKAGQKWRPTDRQALWLLWWYAVDPDGRWLFHHGARRLAKGSGKSPFAAVQCLSELTGPVRFDYFDPSVDGGVVGKPCDMPLVQIAATSESQTANTMRQVRAMATKTSAIVKRFGIDPGKTVMYTETGQLEVITSSAAAAEGAEVTFAVMDETEHWTPATGGIALAETLDRNLAKSSSRAVETANAWEPGIGSVAERTFDAWQAQEEGRTRGVSRILYDARIAPADTDLRDEESLDRALAFVYEDCEWIDRRTLRERVWDPRTKPDVARRFYLNQPTANEDSWVTPTEWSALSSELPAGVAGPVRRVRDGEAVVLFFDGSKSNDATGLVGCAMTDGHVFTAGAWEPDPGDPESVVPVVEVDAAVDAAFDRWDVVAFFADVREWESFVTVSWPERHADGLLVHAQPTGKVPAAIAWDMRSKSFDFTTATELAHAEIVDRAFTHDGHPVLARHVNNARRRPNRYGVAIGKESPSSRRKIDLAVCMIGARMVRRIVLASPAWQKRSARRGSGRVIVLD